MFGHLKSVSLPNGSQISYLLDAFNRRVGKRANNVLTKQFLWQDDLKIAAEYDGNGSLISEFIYAQSINAPDYMIKNGIKYKLVKDHLGSILAVVNAANGVIAQQLTYSTYGHVLSDSNPGFQPFGFAGGLYDPDTKLVRFGAREYNGLIGRWMTKDPILFNGGDTNLYGYVLQDPVNYWDPLGLNQDQIDRSISWLRVNNPNSFNGINPTISDSRIPSLFFKDGLMLPNGNILINTDGLNDTEVLGMVFHELEHARDGYLKSLFKDRHNQIYEQQAIIQQKYDGQKCGR